MATESKPEARRNRSSSAKVQPEGTSIEFDAGEAQSAEAQEFARRLAGRMALLGMSGSDLARAIWGESAPDSRGYKGAKGRDRISAYLNGKSMPGAKTLRMLADALDCKTSELVPERTPATDPTALGVHLSIDSRDLSQVRLDLRLVVPFSAALEILEVLQKHGVAVAEESKDRADDSSSKSSG